MKRSTKVIAATVLTIGVVGTGVAAWKGDGWRRGDHMISHIQSELDLNEQQSQALETLRDELWDIRQTIGSSREANMDSILCGSPAIVRAAVRYARTRNGFAPSISSRSASWLNISAMSTL